MTENTKPYTELLEHVIRLNKEKEKKRKKKRFGDFVINMPDGGSRRQTAERHSRARAFVSPVRWRPLLDQSGLRTLSGRRDRNPPAPLLFTSHFSSV